MKLLGGTVGVVDYFAFRYRRARSIGAYSFWFGSSDLSRPQPRPARDEAVTLMLYKNFEVERVGEAEDVREVFAIAMSPARLKVRLRRRSGALATV